MSDPSIRFHFVGPALKIYGKLNSKELGAWKMLTSLPNAGIYKNVFLQTEQLADVGDIAFQTAPYNTHL